MVPQHSDNVFKVGDVVRVMNSAGYHTVEIISQNQASCTTLGYGSQYHVISNLEHLEHATAPNVLLPLRQAEFLDDLVAGRPITKNAATRMALRRHGFITEGDWDTLEITPAGFAWIKDWMRYPDYVPMRPPAFKPGDSVLITRDVLVSEVYTGEPSDALMFRRGQVGVVVERRNRAGQIAIRPEGKMSPQIAPVNAVTLWTPETSVTAAPDEQIVTIRTAYLDRLYKRGRLVYRGQRVVNITAMKGVRGEPDGAYLHFDYGNRGSGLPVRWEFEAVLETAESTSSDLAQVDAPTQATQLALF